MSDAQCTSLVPYCVMIVVLNHITMVFAHIIIHANTVRSRL